MCKTTVSIRNNAVRFDRKNGLGKIVIRGKFETLPGVDDPVIELWNAVQEKRQASYKELGIDLIHFTILFPVYEESSDTTVYKLVPTNHVGLSTQVFLNRCQFTISGCYSNLFIDSFRQFVIDKNIICGQNLYEIYKECVDSIREETNPTRRENSIVAIKLLIEDFIRFLELPLPQSKEAMSRDVAPLKAPRPASFDPNRIHSLDNASLYSLLYSQEAFDEFFAYIEDDA